MKRGKIGPKLLLMTNRIRAFDWCQNQFQNTCVFGAHHEYLSEDRHTLSAAKMWPNDSSFSQYKVYANIRGIPGERPSISNDTEVAEKGNFQFRSLDALEVRPFLHSII